MGFEGGKVTVGKGGKVGYINTSVAAHGLDPERAAALAGQLSSWRVIGGDVVVDGTASDVNSGIDLRFAGPAGPEAVAALRADLEAIRDQLAALAEDDATPADARAAVAAAAADVGDAAEETAKPKPLSARLDGRIKTASETLEQLSKSAEAGDKLVERGKKAWPVVRDIVAKLAMLGQLARHIPW